MSEYIKRTIKDIVEEINRTYFLPDIQRNFVWKEQQIYALFDSLMRDYPISTMLFWEQTGRSLQDNNIKKLEFTRERGIDSTENTDTSPDKTYNLVLDGQQRLTSFYLALKGTYTVGKGRAKKECDLYFNMESGKDEYEEDGILYEFMFLEKGLPDFFKEGPKAWYKVKSLYGQTDIWNYLQKELFSKETPAQKQSEYKTALAKLHAKLRQTDNIFFYLEKSDKYDKVLDIFVRTNSGGTKLQYSDLLFSNIKLRWPEARKNFAALLKDINGEGFDFDNDFIMKTALLINARTNEDVRYRVTNVEGSFIDLLRGGWEEIEDAMRTTADLLKTFLLTSEKLIPSHNAVIPIAYWIYKNKKNSNGTYSGRAISLQEQAQIRKWLLKAFILGAFGKTSDFTLFKCKQVIDETEQGFPAEGLNAKIYSSSSGSEIQSQFLDEVKYNDKNSFLVLSLCYGNAVNFKPLSKGNAPEQDHVVPKSKLKQAGIDEEKINSIYNIRYIASSDNRSKGKKIIEITSEETPLHFTPPGKWDEANYDKFFELRKELLRKRFEEALK